MSDLTNSEIQLLVSYLKQECTRVEERRVEKWLEDNEDHQQFLSELERIIETPAEEKLDWDVEGSLQRFKEKYGLFEEETSSLLNQQAIKDFTHRKIAGKKKFRYSVAAGFILVLMAVLWLLNQPNNQNPETKTQQFIAERGERVSITLKDGSEVTLNANSSLTLSSGFNDDSRIVNLKGEAFFSVTHNESKPFEVKAGSVYTKVLGTKFNIRSYDSKNPVEVVVTEGKVEVGSSDKNKEGFSQVLGKQQRGVINNKTGSVTVDQVDDISLYTGWKDGKLVFEESSFADVRKELDRWYNINTSVSDKSLDDRQLSASFNDESLIEVLEIISISLQMDYTINNKDVIFSNKES